MSTTSSTIGAEGAVAEVPETEVNYLRVYLAQLRGKLEDDPARPRYLLTEPGMGYRFEPGPDAASIG